MSEYGCDAFYSYLCTNGDDTFVSGDKVFQTMKIGVFCSANNNIDPRYFAAAEELGGWIGDNGHTLVFGGCNTGLMQCTAQAVKRHGGRTVGVIPTLVERGGRVSECVDVQFRCDTLSDRKDLLVSQSDLLVALPGGVGTIDEVFTATAAATIGYHNKGVVLYNVGGFWQPLIDLLDYLAQKGMIRGSWRQRIHVADSLEDIKKMVEEA